MCKEAEQKKLSRHDFNLVGCTQAKLMLYEANSWVSLTVNLLFSKMLILKSPPTARLYFFFVQQKKIFFQEYGKKYQNNHLGVCK